MVVVTATRSGTAVALRSSLPLTARPAVEDFHADYFCVRYSPEFYDGLFRAKGEASQSAVTGTSQTGQTSQTTQGDRDALLRRSPFAEMVLVAATPVDEPLTLWGMATGRLVLDASTGWGDPVWVGYVSTIAVAHEWRGEGLGSMLLDAVIDALMAVRPLHIIRLHVLADNESALGLYYKHGFEIVEYLPDHYKFHGAMHAAYLLERRPVESGALPPRPDARTAALADASAASSFLAQITPGREMRAILGYVGGAVAAISAVAFGASWLYS